MKHFSLACALTCALLGSIAHPASAAVITFDSTPAGGIPVDDAFLTAPYTIAGGGTAAFFFDNNFNNAFDPGTDALPMFEAYGPDANNGFNNDTLALADTANGGLASQLGSHFLRQMQPGTPPNPFIVDYNTAQVITGLSGEVWDIDGAPGNTEQWKVEILDASSAVLATQNSPLGNGPALDGLPWTFSFTGLPAGVDKVRITFTGSKTSGLGLAFNNFDPTTGVPEPGTLAVMGISAIALLARNRTSNSDRQAHNVAHKQQRRN